MSLSRLSDECAGIDGEIPPLGCIKVAPIHDACSGGETRPGLIGGWTCSCPCHSSVGTPAEPSQGPEKADLTEGGDRG